MTTTAETIKERDTLPPAKADESVCQFEAAIREMGESKARWCQLMTLLEESTL